jgi:hypothetical protein
MWTQLAEKNYYRSWKCYARQDNDEVVELEVKHKILDELLDRAEAHRQTYQKKIW